MNCADNDSPDIDESYQEGQKQQVAARSDFNIHQNLRRQHEAAGDVGCWSTVEFHDRTQQQSLYPRPICKAIMDGFFLQQNANAVVSRESAAFQRGPSSALLDRQVENDTGIQNHDGVSGDRIYLTADGNGEVHLGYEGSSGEAEAADDSRQRRKNCTMRDPREESHHRLPLGEVESGDDSDCVVVPSAERKVEPLKINLARDREPLRTIIKLTPGAGSVVDHHSSCSQPLSPTIREVPGSPKITIKPPKPPSSLTEGGSLSSTSGGGTYQNSNSVMSQITMAATVMSSSSSSSSSSSGGGGGGSTGGNSSSSIPKLTIKPVINPTEELLLDEAPAEQMQIIPKLLIKGSSLDATAHSRDGATEPHIVPKLTIRGVNNHNHHLHHQVHIHHHQQQQQQTHYQHHSFGQFPQESSQHYSATGSVVVASSTNDGTGLLMASGVTAAGSPTTPSTPLVPKLTIKMDNHHPHHHHHVQQSPQQQNNLRVTVDSGQPGGSGNRVESPIPKLHIRAIQPEGGGGSSTQSPPSVLGVATAGTSGGNSLTSSEGVKLTIKPLPEPPKLPKLTIKTTGLGTIAETSDASLVSSTSCSFSPKPSSAGGANVAGGVNSNELLHHHPMHLLTVAQQQPASPSDQHSNISSSSIPKLTIKPFSPKIAGQQQQQQSPTGSSQSFATGSQSMGGGDLPQVVPKLTIKPIPAPTTSATLKQSTGEDSNSSSETSINSLESSPVSSSSSSSQPASAVMTTSPSALRMTIKVPPSQDSTSASNVTMGLQTSSSSTGSIVTKLNIKPILPPPPVIPREDGADAPENKETTLCGDGDSTPPSEAEVDPSAAPIVIPKVTIKTLAHPRSLETEILSTPKVTLRPIPKPTASVASHDVVYAPGSPGVGQPAMERHSPQAASGTLNINHSPTAGMTASDGGGSNDSPRIILKINKGSSSTTTSIEQQQQQSSSSSDGMDTTESIAIPPSGGSSILANELKRPATTAAPCVSYTSSSLSSASSTTVSVSTTSSSAGSDPASPSSSAGGGDQGDPGSPEAKKSKLDPVGGLTRVVASQQPFINSDHNAALRQSLLQNHHQQQQQLQLLQKVQQQQKAALASGMPTGAQSAAVSDVIVIDDDSKSENESIRGESDSGKIGSAHSTSQQLQQEPAGSIQQQQFYPLMSNNEAMATVAARAVKPRRTRGTPRGTARGAARGGRQSRRGGAASGRSGAVLLPENSTVSEAPRLNTGKLNHDDHEEGSSSDCMIVDDLTTAVGRASATVASTPTGRTGMSLESLLLGSGSKPPVLYNATGIIPGGIGSTGSGGEVEKNGTASNSSIGSVNSSVGGGTVPTPGPPTMTTPGVAVRMSTRRGAGQLLKEVLANKHHDRDSGVDDETKTDCEGGSGGGLQTGPTPSKRPRGRPKKQSVDLTMETANGGGSSSSMEGNVGSDSMMMALALMGAGADGGTSFLRPDGPGQLGSQQLMEGIMPLPMTPVRTPRTRGRGRGRGRGKLALADGTFITQSPVTDGYDATRRNFALSSGNVDPEGNGDPLFIDGTIDSTNFNLLFNHVQTPRGGGGSVRTRGGRRGAGARGARTPRGGGRGAAKAARAAAAAALLEGTPGPDGLVSSLPPTRVSPLVTSVDPLQTPSSGSLSLSVSSPVADTPTVKKGRARAARGARAASKRKEEKAPRGKKAQEAAAALQAMATVTARMGEMSPMPNAVDASSSTPNMIFMTPMAGGLELNRPKLHVRELKTPKNAVKSNTPPSSAQTTPLAGTTPTGTPGEATPGDGLQVFEEDTRMSGDFNFTTPVRLMMGSGDGCLQPAEESQSSYLSSTSVTQDATTTTGSATAGALGGQPQLAVVAEDGTPESVSTDAQKEALTGASSTSNSNSNSSARRPKGKMEVLDAHRAAFTVDLLAEYEWPPPSPGTRGTDTFMLQEQIAEYLGVKSFKRKYPDLMRRPVDMEERNFLLEQGLASEKMCDLGLTAVYASEILDIMCTDYPDKYEEYTRYTREKHFRELSSRQQRQQLEAASAVAAVAAAPIDRVQLQKEKAIESAANWNCSFNRERRDTRRACMDLQTYVVQVPKRYQPQRDQLKPTPKSEPSNYPVALVPGQFSEYYTTYTPEELACYPINTVLLDPEQLREIVSSERYLKLVAEEEARLRASDDEDSSSSSGSSDDDSDTSSTSSTDEDDDGNSSDSSSSSSSSARSVSPTSDDCGATDIKKELDRRKRTDLNDGEKNDESEVKAVTSASTVSGPVRRSSRALSAGTVVAPAVVEIKEPTDSDDSDVPLIAHAVRKKNLLSAGIPGSTIPHPSIVGGKRMQETFSPVKRPPLNPFMCAVCLGPENKNKYNKPERFVRCNRCRRKAHPSCIGMSSVMYRRVQQYKWQCSECKLCMKCNRSPSAIDSKMVYCDQCDRGYHLACKGLRNLPEGRWHCSLCTICGQCGACTPEGHPNPHLNTQQRQHLAMVAEWTHEYGLNELTMIREHLRTLCVPCVRIRRQRLLHPDQNPTTATVGGTPTNVMAATVAGNEDTKAGLNNNNVNLSNHLKPHQSVGVVGAAAVGANKPQPPLMMNTASSNIKQQPHTVVVQTGSGLPNSHLPSGTKGTMAGEIRR